MLETGSITTAPAPSPKRTSVERSLQSRIFESTSPPTTSALRESPEASIAVGLRDRVHEARAAREQVVGAGIRARPSVSARSAELVGNIMSGVTVAQIRKSISGRVDPCIGERRPRGRQRDVGERLVVGGDPPLADPGALDDPLVGRVDELRRSSFVITRSGHVDAETRDPDPHAVRDRSRAWNIHRSTAKVSVPRAASSSPTCAVAFPRPIGPRTWSISQVSVSVSPGSTMRLKRQSSMPAKNAISAAVLLLDEHGDGAGLRHRLDDQDAGHHGPLREVAREPPVARPHLASRNDPAPGSSSITSSSSRNGSRCGRICSITSRPNGARDHGRRVHWAPPILTAAGGADVSGRVPGDDADARPGAAGTARARSGGRDLKPRGTTADRAATRVAGSLTQTRTAGPEGSARRARACRWRRAASTVEVRDRVGGLDDRGVRAVEQSPDALRAVPRDAPRAGAQRAGERRRDPVPVAEDPYLHLGRAASRKRTLSRSARPSPFGENADGASHRTEAERARDEERDCSRPPRCRRRHGRQRHRVGAVRRAAAAKATTCWPATRRHGATTSSTGVPDRVVRRRARQWRAPSAVGQRGRRRRARRRWG